MRQYSFEKLESEYSAFWTQMRVIENEQAKAQARKVIINKSRYKAVEQLTGIPWFVVGCLHMRESNGNFQTWMHNGDPMKRNGVPVQTVHVPEKRPVNPDCTWEDGAYDALVEIEHLDEIKNWNPARVAYAAECYNGFGYRSPSRDIPSPYLWGGTSIQKPGKFVRDGVYDSTVMDKQTGVMAILQILMATDQDAKFQVSVPQPLPQPVPQAPPISPRADDTVSEAPPLKKSRTIWGGILLWLSGNTGIFTAVFDRLTNPYALAAFLSVILFTSIGLYLVISGRINVQNIIKHLSDDDSGGA